MAISQPTEFKQLLSDLNIVYTPAELHGFLSGLIVGGVQDESWKTLLYQMSNDGHAFSQQPLERLSAFYQQLNEEFEQLNTLFSLWLPNDDNGFALADCIAQWSSQFLLALGLAQPHKYQSLSGDAAEALEDLENIAQLGYDESDDPNELLASGEEIIDYLRVACLYLHSHFIVENATNSTKLH